MTQLGTLTQTTLLSATTGTMPGNLLPLWQKKLLLPSITVVDVIPASGMAVGKSKKSGILGHVIWQQNKLPVLMFEVLNGDKQPPEPQALAIIHSVSIADKIEHYALALQAEPAQVKVKISELEDLDRAPVGPMEYLQVRYQEALAVIPDLDALEAKLLTLQAGEERPRASRSSSK